MAHSKGSEAERAEVELIAQLMERMAARKRPITAAQVARFMRHPAGPILPDLCVEARRLPDSFSAGNARPADRALLALAANAQGEPIFVTLENDRYVIGIGDERHETHLLNSYPVHGWSPRILGSGAVSGEPIVAFCETRNIEDLAHGSPEKADLYWKTVVYKGGTEPFSDTGVHGLTLFENGSLVHARRCEHDAHLFSIVQVHPSHPQKETINGEVFAEEILGFFEDERGTLCCIYREFIVGFEGGKRLVGAIVLAAIHDWNAFTLHRFGDEYRWAGMFEGLLCAVSAEHGESAALLCLNPTGPDTHRFEELKKLGSVTFRGGLTKLKDCRDAWIGTVRDFLASWVVEGESQPGFELVSPIFYRDGKPHYYGVIGRYLYTMTLPPIKK